ncbi:AraC family ligand binding domain-containing protein, partial [Falsiroseomonas oryzae]|uniref:AraC family ligand binding domain-containing protein n=1 Tax=Falsiroseomonas oryzae TaxID=2766473 RepID=UPI0022EB28DC
MDRPLAAFARDYADGESVPRHAHDRAQLLYATRGVMRIATDAAAFVVPPGHALWMPAGEPHRVAIEGAVAMRALFLRADAAVAGPVATTVLAVSPLLRELILAACAEPLEWDEAGRGGHLAALIIEEIARAAVLPFGVPEPRDTRLCRVAAALRADPADARRLEEWAEAAGASPRTLERLFLAETGMGFARWRQRL